jgi:diguanylate cyclase (GGDEF)-like protein
MTVSNSLRIAVGLMLMAVCVVSGAIALGLVESRANSASRVQLRSAEALAVQLSSAMTAGDGKIDVRLIDRLVSANPGMQSLGLRRGDGRLVAASPSHADLWQQKLDRSLDPRRAVSVPLYNGDAVWGSLELVYVDPVTPSFLADWKVLAFVGASCLLAFSLYMRRTLRVLDPSNVVPDRVKAMLNTLTEGTAILDPRGQIMLANQSFAAAVSATDRDALVGKAVDSLRWNWPADESTDASLADRKFPWTHALGGNAATDVTLEVNGEGGPRTFVTNASPVRGARGEVRGVLVTLSDVTAIREQNKRLEQLVGELNQSREQIRQQNEELQRLATRDALTDCLNRRAFHSQLEQALALSLRHADPLSVLMIDVDHFKGVNDRFGHAVGDAVLRGVADRIRATLRSTDLVCRFGGEEFCVLLPKTASEDAAAVAEQLRAAIAHGEIAGVAVTASFGVGSIDRSEITAAALLEQADAALYASKRNGRNRVTVADPSIASTARVNADSPDNARAAA